MEEIMPYMCATKEYNLKVDNEKQLTMHKRKHDMILSLNKTNPCPSDETPTPTRFIRNCEAIGLFQDLQNVNPFEETFRQATEAVKKGECLKVPSVPSLGKPAGEDLHTPHIYLKDDGHLSDDKVCDYEMEKVSQSEIGTPIKTAFSASPGTTAMIKENKIDYKTGTDDLHFFLKMANGALVQITSSSNNFEILKSSVLTNGSISLAAPVIPNIDYAQPEPPQPVPDMNSSAAVKKKLKETLLKTPKPKITSNPEHCINQDSKVNHQSRKEKQVPITVVEDPETDRKRKSLERNRIAAMKCREKRKKWVADLREKYEKMCFTNQALAKEVVFLRKEVARLKGLLITSSQIRLEDISPSTTTVNLISPSSSPKRPSSSPDLDTTGGITSSLKGPREGLRLDIEGASRNAVMDLDSPLVRKDEILSSVAPPTTPNERLISFTELDRDSEVVEVTEERAATTVIQINPNALAKSSLGFS